MNTGAEEEEKQALVWRSRMTVTYGELKFKGPSLGHTRSS